MEDVSTVDVSNDNHNVYNCKHHTLPHGIIPMSKESTNGVSAIQPDDTNLVNYMINSNQGSSLLPTALVYIVDGANSKQMCHVLLDSGSQGSFITENCAQRLKLKRSSAKIAISGIGATTNGFTKGLVSLIITPWNKDEPKVRIEAFVFPKLTTKQPPITKFIDINYFNQYELADPLFYKDKEVDIIVGSDTFFELLSEGKATYDGIVMQNTLLGWVVAGESRGVQSSQSIAANVGHCEDNLDVLLRKFWEIETISDTSNHLSKEESYCEKYFKETTRMTNSNSQFEVRLPFKLPPSTLGCSFRAAVQRMHSMEKRFIRDPNYGSMYKDFMNECIQLGHMKAVNEIQVKVNGYYLPHHGVLKS